MRSNTLMLGTRKGLIVYRRKAGKWVHDGLQFPGIPVTIATIDKLTGSWWALLDHGHWGCKVHRSDDEGRTWTELEAPKYPEGAMVTETKEANLRLLWAFSNGGETKPGRIWIGTEPGGLFISEDNGANFELVKSLWEHPSRGQWFGGGRDFAAIHSVLVDPRDNEKIKIGISCAGVFSSEDSGASWEVRNKGLIADFLPNRNAEVGQDPHILIAAPSNPDVLWQQNHCGIFYSLNEGKTWEECGQKNGPAHFGFCIGVSDVEESTAWVVPAVSDEVRVTIDSSLVVCRTENFGKSWETLQKGLPKQVAHDIVFRHAFAVSGDELAFGSTTGNLFYSSDGGDSWDILSNFLPMIHSVEFV